MEKILKLGIERKDNWLYFIDKQGDVSRVRIGEKGSYKVHASGIDKEPHYIYFLDKHGDISRAPMKRHGVKSFKEWALEKDTETLEALPCLNESDEESTLEEAKKPKYIKESPEDRKTRLANEPKIRSKTWGGKPDAKDMRKDWKKSLN